MKRFRIALLILSALCATAITSPAQTFEVLASVPEILGGGASSLTQGTNGNLYGTTSTLFFANGTIFEYTPHGKLIGSFDFNNYTNGASPTAGVVLGSDGNFYGTTSAGGAEGYGTVFRITTTGQLTSLFSFDLANGQYPDAIVQASDGNLYGTTAYGGSSGECVGDGYSGCGTVFQLTTSGKLTTLYSFDLTQGAFPGTLVQADNGNFYGTASSGGAHCQLFSSGCGTVFEITPLGRLTTLYNFCPQAPECPDGMGPVGLVLGSNGNFYGTTSGGGANCPASTCGGGTVFQITPAGNLTTLYSFCSQAACADGEVPVAGLVQGTDGNFYGMTNRGGFCSTLCGTIFEITPGGKLNTIHRFCCADGEGPGDALVQATDGTFYGTTSYGGAYENGTIFSLSTGLSPFVETVPVFGTVGKKIIILGNNLTGTTSVTFNGTEAIFKVASATAIVAEVPSGATTGTVQVVTPSGTLSSNVVFRIL